MKPFIALPRDQVSALVREAPEAVVNLVMVMQEKLAELTEQVGRLQQRVAELEEENRPPSAPFRRREDERSTSPKKPGRPPGHPGSCRRVPTHIDEQIEVLTMPFKEALQKALSNEFEDSKTVIGMMWAARYLSEAVR